MTIRISARDKGNNDDENSFGIPEDPAFIGLGADEEGEDENGKKPKEEDDDESSSLGPEAEALDLKDLQELSLLKSQLVKEKKLQKRIDKIKQRHIEWMRKNKPEEIFKDWLRVNFPVLYSIEYDNTEKDVQPEPLKPEENAYPISKGFSSEEAEAIRDFWKDYNSRREVETESKDEEANDLESNEPDVQEAQAEEDFSVDEVVDENESDDVLLTKQEKEEELKKEKEIDEQEATKVVPEKSEEEEADQAEPSEDFKKQELKNPKKGKGEAYDKRVIEIPTIEDAAIFAYLPSVADDFDYDTENEVESFSEDQEYSLGELRNKFKGKIPKATPKIKEEIVNLLGALYGHTIDEYERTTRSKNKAKGAMEIKNEMKSEQERVSTLNDLEARVIKQKLFELQKQVNRLKKTMPQNTDQQKESEEGEEK